MNTKGSHTSTKTSFISIVGLFSFILPLHMVYYQILFNIVLEDYVLHETSFLLLSVGRWILPTFRVSRCFHLYDVPHNSSNCQQRGTCNHCSLLLLVWTWHDAWWWLEWLMAVSSMLLCYVLSRFSKHSNEGLRYDSYWLDLFSIYGWWRWKWECLADWVAGNWPIELHRDVMWLWLAWQPDISGLACPWWQIMLYID